jgi:hypothetical protein
MPMKPALSFLLGIALLLAGCVSPAHTPSASREMTAFMESPARMQEPRVLQESLFSSDTEVLSNDAVERLLLSRIRLPAQGRLAILTLNRRFHFHFWSEQSAQFEQEKEAELLASLQQSDRIEEALYLPAIMVPAKTTLPYLREAAARLQAHLLLVYATSYHDFQNYRVLKSDRTKTRCRVEAILLDVRTGVVPFTATSTFDFEAAREPSDFNFQETIMRVRSHAERQALQGIVTQLREFLSRADAGP